MKLYLDDERAAPVGWVRVDNVEDCISILKSCDVSDLSLDHDLGREDQTGYDVLAWMEEEIRYGSYNPPQNMAIHTANPPARERMTQALDSISLYMRCYRLDWECKAGV